MKRWPAGLLLLCTLGLLGGCYNDPGYSYVRGNSVSGDAYYGTPTTTYRDPYDADGLYGPSFYGGGFYNPAFYPGFSPGFYPGYGYRRGSNVSVGVGSVWHTGGDYPRDYGRDDRHAFRQASEDHGWYGSAQENRRRGRSADGDRAGQGQSGQR